MGRKPKWPPPVYTDKSSGRCRLRIWHEGELHDFPLGLAGTAEARAEYDRLVAEIAANGVRSLLGGCRLVAQVVAAYLRYAQSYYGKKQFWRLDTAFNPVNRLYGDHRVERFGPLALKACVAVLARTYNRRLCNQMQGCIKEGFRWAASEELIPDAVYTRLTRVRGLRKGKTEAKEPEDVAPVDPVLVRKTLAWVLPPVAGLIRLGVLTGCRPGEAIRIRGQDIVRPWREIAGKQVWLYVLRHDHKNGWRGMERQIPLCPEAQELLLPLLAVKRPGEFLFSPRDALTALRQRQARERKTPLSCGNRPGTNRKRRALRAPGERYTSESYSQAIRKACARASLERWAPNQLRHLVGTRVEVEYDQDAARCVLGHTQPQTTAIYAESTEKAATVLVKLGGALKEMVG